MIDDINFSRVTSGNIDDDAANVIMQVEEWFNARTDQLNTIVQMPAEATVQIGEVNLDSESDIRAFKLGVIASLTVLGKFPLSISTTSTEEDE